MISSFTVGIDSSEVAPMIAELRVRVQALGVAEAARRVGRPITAELIRDFIRIEQCAPYRLRLVPTPAFDVALLALW